MASALFTQPMPLAAAVQRLESKTPVAAALSADEWAKMDLGLRDRAFWAAKVSEIQTVSSMQQKLDDALRLTVDENTAFTDRAKFIADMRVELGASPGDSGDLTDITSTARLGLIYDFQIEDAREYARFQAGQDAAILDAYPCQELIRLWEPKGGPEARRDWPQRWIDAGGVFYDEGRMIAAKDDPIWKAISRFGRPWPPFDYNSGMGLEDIDRDEAEQLGVIAAGEIIAPQAADFNQALETSAPEATPAVLEGFKNAFGDQVDVGRDGKITWQGQRVQKLFDSIATNPAAKDWSIDLGTAPGETVAAAKTAGVDLTGAKLILQRDALVHLDKVHGPGREVRPDQRPLTSLDYQLIPHVWRAPDSVRLGDQPGTLVFEADLAGRRTLVVFDRGVATGLAPANRWGVKTLYVKKEEGGTP